MGQLKCSRNLPEASLLAILSRAADGVDGAGVVTQQPSPSPSPSPATSHDADLLKAALQQGLDAWRNGTVPNMSLHDLGLALVGGGPAGAAALNMSSQDRATMTQLLDKLARPTTDTRDPKVLEWPWENEVEQMISNSFNLGYSLEVFVEEGDAEENIRCRWSSNFTMQGFFGPFVGWGITGYNDLSHFSSSTPEHCAQQCMVGTQSFLGVCCCPTLLCPEHTLHTLVLRLNSGVPGFGRTPWVARLATSLLCCLFTP